MISILDLNMLIYNLSFKYTLNIIYKLVGLGLCFTLHILHQLLQHTQY